MNQSLRASSISLASCLITLVGISVLSISPALAQVNGLGPSPSSTFDVVFNTPADNATIFQNPTIGMAGQTTQFNINGSFFQDFLVTGPMTEVNLNAGNIGFDFIINSGSEFNISGGTVDFNPLAQPGSVVNQTGGSFGQGGFTADGSLVNISGGNQGLGFRAINGTDLNISGGTIGALFGVESSSVANISGGSFTFIEAFPTSEINFLGSQFSINGTPLNLSNGQPFTITNRDVTLTGILDDGSPISFDLNSSNAFGPGDFFSPDATITVTVPVPEPSSAAFMTLALAMGLARRRRR